MSTSSTEGASARSARPAVGAIVAVAIIAPGGFLMMDGVLAAVVFFLSALLPSVAIAITMIVPSRRPEVTRPWRWALGGSLCLALDAAIWLLRTAEPSLPEGLAVVAQIAVLLGYTGLLVATVLLVLPAMRDDGGKAIDSAIFATGAAVLLWAGVVDTALTDRVVSSVDRSVALVGLLLVSGIAGAMGRAIVTSQRARFTLGCLALAALAAIVANMALLVNVDETTGVEAPWVGALWVLSNVTFAAAALRPQDLTFTASHRPRTQRLSYPHLGFLALALSLNPLLAAARESVGEEADQALLTTGTLVLVPLVLARVAQLARLQHRTEQELAHQATHDALTGLPNRRAADQHLDQTIRQVREGTLPGALLCFLDLDNFKDVNDEHGHHVGDQLLVAVAGRLQAVVRERDLVARFGGDEFILIIIGAPDVLRTETVARIHQALSAPVDLGSTTASAVASIGTAAVRRGNELSGEQLTSIADARMYAEKRRATHGIPVTPA